MKHLRNFEKFNESSSNDFLNNYTSDIKTAVDQLKSMRTRVSKITNDREYEELLTKAFSKIENVYDETVVDFIERSVGDPTAETNIQDIVRIAIENQNQNGTEPQMILLAIEDVAGILK